MTGSRWKLTPVLAMAAWLVASGPTRPSSRGRRRRSRAARGQPLSARELEVARLAANGVPNKEIAARLHLSLHTIENRLHVVYEKLGVNGRAELRDALDPH